MAKVWMEERRDATDAIGAIANQRRGRSQSQRVPKNVGDGRISLQVDILSLSPIALGDITALKDESSTKAAAATVMAAGEKMTQGTGTVKKEPREKKRNTAANDKINRLDQMTRACGNQTQRPPGKGSLSDLAKS